MKDLILLAVIILILAAATIYIVRAKKSGITCIGCPDAKTCSGHCSSNNTIDAPPTNENVQQTPVACNGNCSGCNGGCKLG